MLNRIAWSTQGVGNDGVPLRFLVCSCPIGGVKTSAARLLGIGPFFQAGGRFMATQSKVSRFPAWFPPNCPPADAADAEGVVFRFVSRNAVDAEDFLSHYERGEAPRAQPCRRCGLSVYRTLESARSKLRDLRGRYPDRFATYIAEGTLTPEHGKIKQEGKDRDHHEWWAYEGVERRLPFRVAESLDG